MITSVFKICAIVQFVSLLNSKCRIFPVVNGKEVNFSENETLTENNKNLNDSTQNNYVKSELNSNKSTNNEENKNVENSSWFLNVPLLPTVVATSNSIPEGPCKRQLNLYLRHLKNGTLWATEMFDSSAKYPYGIFDGLTRHLGSFDQCYRIQTTIPNNEEDGKIEEIRSRYCLVDIKYQEKDEPTNFTGKLDIWFDPQGSAWESIREKGDFRRYQRYLLQMALCVPATCHPGDIVSALKEPLEKFSTQYNLKVQASIQKGFCQAAHEAPKFSNYARAYCFVVLLIIALVIISTIFDDNSVQEEKQSLEKQLLFCFSARRSLNSIFRVNYRHRGLDSLHMLRFIFAIVVITGHRQIQVMHGSNINGRYFESTMSLDNRIVVTILHNGSIIVDGFLGLGGLVLSYQLLEILEKPSRLNIPLLIIKRFVRLAPLHIFVVFAYATLFHHFGSGPFWEHRFGFDRDSCSSYWWANLFFINNYVNGKNTCVFQSWYLAVDFQCFIVGLLLIGAFRKMSRKVGYVFLGGVLSFATAIPFYMTYKYNIDPIFIALGIRRRMEDYDYFTDYYIKTHMRLPAYIVGIIVGAFIYDYKSATWRLPKTWSRVLIILQVVVLSLYIQHLGIYFIDPNEQPSLFEKALYASLHRPIFAFSMCSVALLITIGDGLDFHYNFMTPRWVQPISKLSYGMFLLHFAIQSYELGTARAAYTNSFYNLVKLYILDSILTLVLTLFFVLVIEEPFKNVGNLLLMRSEPKKPITSSEPTKKVD